MKKILSSLLGFIIFFIIIGCANINDITETMNRKLLFPNKPSPYYLLAKINKRSDIKSDTLKFFKENIIKVYQKENKINSIKSINDKIIITMSFKENYFKNKCLQLINRKCYQEKHQLEELKKFLQHPTNIEAMMYGAYIKGMNRACATIRMGGGNCRMVHSINDLYEVYLEKYEQCKRKYNFCSEQFKNWKVIIEYSFYNPSVLKIKVKIDSHIPRFNLVEEYVAIDYKNTIYILFLNKHNKYSKIFKRKLLLLPNHIYMDLIKIMKLKS